MQQVDHLVVGRGQVGSAVAELLSEAATVAVRDIDDHKGLCSPHTLDVCFPWSEGFEDEVQRYCEAYEPQCVVVHSTVPVGTCDRHGWVHSPVRGKHPNLIDGLRTFTKFFSSEDGSQAIMASATWIAAGIDVEYMPTASDSEAAKLWELLQYGINIAVEKEINNWCEQHQLSFDHVYTRMAQTYNEGYNELGESRFVRPIIEHVPGPLGGHCVSQNANKINHWLADWIAAS